MGVTASRADDYAALVNPDAAHLNVLTGTPPGLGSGDRNGSSRTSIAATEFVWSFGGSSIYVTGAWDDWQVQTALARTTPTDHTAVLALPLGTFQYKFIVDGNWKHSPALPSARDQHGNMNNVVIVKEQIPEYDANTPIQGEVFSSSPMESYDFSALPQEDHTTEPPALPRLLASAPLDRLTDSTSSGTEFVRFNHMFITNSDATYGPNEIRTMASELRYKSKVITTILIMSKSKMHPHPGHDFRSNRAEPIPIESQSRERSMQPMGESQSLILDALNNV